MGAINIDNTGSGSSVTLSSDGTSLLLNGSAISGGGGSSTLTIQNKTGAYTVVAGDLGTIINCTSGTFTVSLTAAATLGAGFNCWIWNTSTTSSHVITIDPNGSETIDFISTIILRTGEGMQIVCDGTNWQTGDKKTMRAYAERVSNGESRPVASGSASVALGIASTASGTSAFAAGGWATASGQASLAIGGYISVATASSSYSSALGNNSAGRGSQAVTGSGAMALGGSYASGTDSFAAAVANNTSTYGATGTNSIALGYLTKASGSDSVSIGGGIGASVGSIASGVKAGCYSAAGATASGQQSIIIGGDSGSATQRNAIVIGGLAARSDIRGKVVFGGDGNFSGFRNSFSECQTGLYNLRVATTSGTASILNTDGNAGGTTNQVILPNNSAHAFTGIVVARQQASGGTSSAAWEVKGLIRREGSAATTVLVNSATTVLSNLPGWTLALSADTTNGGLAITVTGAASTNIRWVATIQTSEVTYA